MPAILVGLVLLGGSLGYLLFKRARGSGNPLDDRASLKKFDADDRTFAALQFHTFILGDSETPKERAK